MLKAQGGFQWAILTTDIIRNAPLFFRITHKILVPPFCQRLNSHAAASVIAPALLDRDQYKPDSYHTCDGVVTPVSRIARDDEKADRLWKITSDLVKFPDMMTM